ncbi:DEAD/DEAH box helicase-like protein 2 [Elsinoe australis]|uniref:ATP-dependent DNA helicase n=1 Tax=Elsinoe australis TaxID=40998 RepID=A0A4U7B4I5_9PEZI|nr:DEAD/DEAH box helicase-like protein 2 [Elsinoe australis]
MTITDEELESVLDYREDVASPPPLQQEPPSRKRGRNFARDQRGIDRVMERIETQVEEKTTLRTTKQNYLITRHLVRNRGPYAYPVWTMNDKTAQLVSDFTELLRRPKPDYDQIWKAYIALPQPRVVYFSGQVLVDFLALLRRVKVKHKDVVSRYLTVMEDMSQSDCRISPRDLNSAIHWIGRTKDVDPGESLEKAVEMFQKYEDGFMKGDLVTFNTLGYLALKAKRNGMVRTILETVAERQLQNDRYTYMLKIAYYGKMKNIQGVKKEYKNMIAAGELIDTIALNAVIRALLDAGDIFMAEKTLERMKEIHVTKTQKPYAPEDWIGQRKLGHVLKYSAWQLRHHHDLRAEMQDLTPITPNSHTYRILIEHHAKVTGNLDRMVDLLGEALESNFPIQFGTWRDIFDGFEKHRYIRFSSWTASNLRKLHELFSDEVKRVATRGNSAAPSQYGEGRPRVDSTAIASLISAPLQREVITAALEGHDVYLQAATSFGKSLCFQLPAVIDIGLTVVISPLLALMKNQITSLAAAGVPVASINSSTLSSEKSEILKDLQCGHPKTKLLYVTPELCALDYFRRILKIIHSQRELARIAIDEAHCISEWGHDFRTSFQELSFFRREFPDVPMICCTATATPKVRNDIIRALTLDELKLKVFTMSTSRPNLHYEVRFKSDEEDHYDAFLTWMKHIYKRRQNNPDRAAELAAVGERPTNVSGIIYTLYRRDTEALAERLVYDGIGAKAYHAGLSHSEKDETLQNWVANKPGYDIIVATTAFGMGIDKEDVRFVVHWQIPKSFEGFYQEAGRAGRDGKASLCILYYSREDRDRSKSMLMKEMAKSKGKRNVEAAFKQRADSLQKLVSYCEETRRCRHKLVSEYFGDQKGGECDWACDFCKDKDALARRKENGLASEEWCSTQRQTGRYDYDEYD